MLDHRADVSCCRLTHEKLDKEGVSFATAMQTFHSVLPADAVLMSYNIDTDLKWLNLEYKIDREACIQALLNLLQDSRKP